MDFQACGLLDEGEKPVRRGFADPDAPSDAGALLWQGDRLDDFLGEAHDDLVFVAVAGRAEQGGADALD